MGLRSDSRGVIVSCPSCQQANRLAYDRLGLTTRCGRCQTDLQAPGVPVDVSSSADFDAVVRGSRLPVLVDFWAEGAVLAAWWRRKLRKSPLPTQVSGW